LQNFIIFFEPYGGCKQHKNTKKPQEKGGASSTYSAMAIGLQRKSKQAGQWSGFVGYGARKTGQGFGSFLLHKTRAIPFSSSLFHSSFFFNPKQNNLFPLIITQTASPNTQSFLKSPTSKIPTNTFANSRTRRRKRIQSRNDMSIKGTTNFHMNSNEMDLRALIMAYMHEYR
jgi:hypothetical protein